MGNARTRLKAPLESETQRDILLCAPSIGCRLLRNNVGAFQDATGRWVHFGVGGDGGSDLIGWTDDAGTAVWTVVEVKRKPRKPTTEQQAFVDAAIAAGGIGVVAYSVQDFRDAISDYRLASGLLRESATKAAPGSGPRGQVDSDHPPDGLGETCKPPNR